MDDGYCKENGGVCVKIGTKCTKRIWDYICGIPDRIGRLCPPGFDFSSEWKSNGLLFGIGIGMSFQFLTRLQDAYDRLFAWYQNLDLGQKEPVYQIREGAIAPSYVELMEGYWWWFLPWIVALFGWGIAHFLYYYRETQSIYVMRRIKRSGVVLKSCILAPIMQLLLGLCVAATVYFVDYGWYLLLIPKVCMPGFW